MAPYSAGQQQALSTLKLAGLADVKRVLLGALLLGGTGYAVNHLWNKPLEQNKPIPRPDYTPAEDRYY